MVGSVETQRTAEVASNISRLHHEVRDVFVSRGNKLLSSAHCGEREREWTREIHRAKLRERMRERENERVK